MALDLKKLTAYLSLVGMVASAIYVLEGRYAHAQDSIRIETGLGSKIQDLETKLELKVLSDELYQVRERKWKLQDRLDRAPDSADVKADLREMESKEIELRYQLETIGRNDGSTPLIYK